MALAIVFASERWRPWMLLLIMLPFWTNLLIRTYALIAVLRTEGYVNFTLAWLWDQASWLMTLVGLAAARRLHAAAAAVQQFRRGGRARLRPSAIHGAAALCRARPARQVAASKRASTSAPAISARCSSIVVPLALPGIISGIIITFVPALGAYLTPDLLGGPDSQMIANVIERQFKQANDWPFGAALSFLLMYVTFGAIALRAYFSRGKPADGHGI